MHALYLAWQYLRFNRLRTLTLIACVPLIAALPLSLAVRERSGAPCVARC